MDYVILKIQDVPVREIKGEGFSMFMEKTKEKNGITLVALVITVVILIILAGIAISQLTGSGLLNKTLEAKEENDKQTATETINFKITNIQISSYAENKELPTLQYLADKLCEDDDMEYVTLASKATASLDKIDASNVSSIYTKLKDYSYEFEINSSLQLESIDGIKIATTEKETIQEGYIKPSGTYSINSNGEYNIAQYEKVNVNVVTDKKYTEEEYQQFGTEQYNSGYTNGTAIGGKGIYWNRGTETIKDGDTADINIGFVPSYIVFTRRGDNCDIAYCSNVSNSKQYIRGVACNLNRGDTGIVSVGEIVKLYSKGKDTVWDWIAVKQYE